MTLQHFFKNECHSVQKQGKNGYMLWYKGALCIGTFTPHLSTDTLLIKPCDITRDIGQGAGAAVAINLDKPLNEAVATSEITKPVKVFIDDFNKRFVGEEPETELPADTLLRFEIGGCHYFVSVKDGKLQLRKNDNSSLSDTLTIQPIATNQILIS